MPDIQKLNVNGTDFDIDDPNDVEKDNGELAETVINYESATTPTIGSFTAFLNQFVSGTKVGQWFKNFRAGCDFLLHIGSLVNNCVTDNEALPLAAAQGKVLMDLITSSNDEFSEEITQLKSDLTELVTYTVHSNTDDYFCESYQYSDGRMVINQRWLTQITNSSYDQVFYYQSVTLPTFPISFSSKPCCWVFAYGSGSTRNGLVWGQTVPSATSAGQVYFGRASSFEAGNITFEVHSEGRWF